MTESTMKITSRISPSTIHMPAFFVNSAQASRHQLVARPASTLRDSTTVPVVASSIARSLLAVT